jgi:hypothetical protein
MNNEQSKLSDELKKIEYEPLLPIEKKLITWSIILGVAFIIALYIISRLLVN